MTAETHVQLLYGGQLYSHWLSYDVSSSLARPASAFRLSVRPPDTFDPLTVEPGSIAQLLIGPSLVMWGRVDEVELARDRQRTTMEIHGRDAGGLLVDCAADYTWRWRNAALSAIAATVCTYAGLVLPPVGGSDVVVKDAQVEPGESCWDFLSRLADAGGVDLWIEADGHLEIGSYDLTGTYYGGLRDVPGQVGNTILRSSVHRSTADAISEVTVLSHWDEGGGQTRFKGEWLDLSFPYFKPRVAIEPDCKSAADATAKARQIGTAARASRFEATYVVRGHERIPGEPWAVNQLLWVQDQPHGVNGVHLVVGRRFRHSRDEDQTTELVVVRPEDFGG